MKRTAAVCALALLALGGVAGGALASKGGDPGPPSQPPGQSGSAPGQERKAQPSPPAQNIPAANRAKSAGPATQARQPKPKPKPKKTSSSPAKAAKPKPKPTKTQSSHAKAGKITICHRTGSEKNPFVQITVSANAWKGHQKHGDLNPVPAGGCPAGSPTVAAVSAVAAASVASPAAVTTPAAAPGQPSASAAKPSPTAQGTTPSAAGPNRAKQKIAAQTQPSAGEKEAEPGVLGAVRDLGAEVRRQNLPFTGLPIWVALLAGAALAGTGLGVRRWTRSAASA